MNEDFSGLREQIMATINKLYWQLGKFWETVYPATEMAVLLPRVEAILDLVKELEKMLDHLDKQTAENEKWYNDVLERRNEAMKLLNEATKRFYDEEELRRIEEESKKNTGLNPSP